MSKGFCDPEEAKWKASQNESPEFKKAFKKMTMINTSPMNNDRIARLEYQMYSLPLFSPEWEYLLKLKMEIENEP